jgi:exoribonuclease-2
MHLLFEDDGELKAGSILADNETSLAVEAASGRRLKVKAASVLMRFASPSPVQAMADAQRLAGELDPNFLWEASEDGDFSFVDLAHAYYGAQPTASQAAAVALALASAPMYFYKRGKGRYRRAPPDVLQAALASVERKAREAQQIDAWVTELKARRLPDALRDDLDRLLYRPDKNALTWKALAAACTALKTSPLELLAACGAINSTHDYHFKRFLATAFPAGVEFPSTGPIPRLPELPLAEARAFSIDDATTTEIDDAFSVRELSGGTLEIGIHIACPALAIPRGSALDAIARSRLSTVYMPGRKLTMLPEDVVGAFTLREGAAHPALSLYVETTQGGEPLRYKTLLERVTIAANLRLDALDETFVDAATANGPVWARELRALWRFAEHLSGARGATQTERAEYSFYIDWDAEGIPGERGRVTIVPRARGSPLDRLIAELMIHVNSTWGKALADAGIAGLYRVQAGGKVKMSTRSGEHQGLGLSNYLWASSPLRRYSDLVNQRQLLAWLAGSNPPYAENDAELYAALADFETTYAQYAEFQDRMERYWCLRWLVQEHVDEITAAVIRDDLVRFDRVPLIVRLPGMPGPAPDTRVRVAISRIDLLEATLECRYAGPEDATAETETV